MAFDPRDEIRPEVFQTATQLGHVARDDVNKAPEEPGDPLALWALDQISNSKDTIDKWRKNATDCDRFAAGKHFTPADKEAMEQAQRPTAAFNAAQKWLRLISGLERQSRLEVQYLPRDVHNEQQTMEGELVTDAHNWVLQNCHGDNHRSRAFLDAVRRGMGWTDTTLDRSMDASGLVVLRRVDGHEMLWDSRSTDHCLMDARWVGRERQISKREALKRWPEHEGVILANVGQSDPKDRPGTSTLVTEVKAIPIETPQWPPVSPGNVKVVEFQWYDEVIGVYFYDPLEGKDDWLDDKTFKEYHAKYKRVAPGLRARAADPASPLTPQERTHLAALPDTIEHDRCLMREYQRMLIIGRTVVWGPAKLPGRRFTFNCITGEWDDEDGIWMGFFKKLIDPQKYMTKFANQVMEIITRSAKGGVIIEEDAVDNPVAFEQKWAQTGSVNVVKAGKIGAILEKTPPQIPAAAIEMFQVCSQMLREVTGIDPSAVMGMGSADLPAVTMRQRQVATLILLAEEFDNLRLYRELEAKTIFDFLQFIADDRWVRVGGPDKTKVVQLIRTPFVLEYDVVMEEGTSDPSVREKNWQDVKEAMPMLARQNIFPLSLIDFAPWHPSMKRIIKAEIQQQVQQRQKMAQLGLQVGGRGKPTSIGEIQAREQKLKADAALAQAKAMAAAGQVKSSRGKMLLDGVIKYLEMQQSQQQHQQQMGLERMKGASNEAMGLAKIASEQMSGERDAETARATAAKGNGGGE